MTQIEEHKGGKDIPVAQLVGLQEQYLNHASRCSDSCFKVTSTNIAVTGALIAFISTFNKANLLSQGAALLICGLLTMAASIAAFILVEYYSRKYRAYEQFSWVLFKGLMRDQRSDIILEKIRTNRYVSNGFLQKRSVSWILRNASPLAYCNLLPLFVGAMLCLLSLTK